MIRLLATCSGGALWAFSSACRNCAFFKSECIGSGIEHTVFEIPSYYKKLQKLIAAGILDLSKVLDGIGLNPNQDRAKQSALSGKTLVDSGLKAVLDAIQWPCYYLDFETVQTFLPLLLTTVVIGRF